MPANSMPASSIRDWVYDRTGNETLADVVDWFIGRPLTIALIIVIALIVRMVVKRLLRRLVVRMASTRVIRDPRSEARADSIVGIVGSALSIVIWLMATFMVVSEFGIDLAPLLAGAGIAGIALGFGAQSLVRDWLSGLFMIIEDQFGLGDWVDLGEASGVVEKMTLRTTVVRSLDGTVWHVPNGEIQRVGNQTQRWAVAIVDVAVPHEAPLEIVKAAVLDAARAVCAEDEHAPHVLETPQLLGVESVTVESVSLRLLVKTTPGDQWGLQRALREAIKLRFDELHVGIPLPGKALWSRLAGQPPATED